MSSKILINALDPEECRIAKVTDSKLEEFHIESTAKEITHGNIYKGIITRIEPGLQSVFVDYGAERHGFLQKHEIHPDYFLDNLSGDQSIKSIVKRGQELLVQVTKDPVMKKGAMLTTYISLPGRYIVLMPGSKNTGISRKIEDEEERSRLKELVNSVMLPQGFGIIVRTAGSNCNKTSLIKDLKYLLRLWENINNKGVGEDAPALLYKERNLVLRSIRDYFTPDITEILVDDEAVHHEVKNFFHIISPKHTRIVKLHTGPKPIFTKHALEDQIASIFENRVELKSGGSIVIDQTEALVAIDVNSGKGIHKKNIEQTAFSTNIEAAEEIARQLRMRDLGGLIVIDFIDMRDMKHKQEVERSLKSYVKADKARIKLGKISKFGLMEMSRQRIRPSIEYGGYLPCKHCQGKGLLPSAETLAISFLRKLHLETLKEGITHVKGIVPVSVAGYLLNSKKKEILDLEMRREIRIVIEGDASMLPRESRILCEQ
ncbi:Ribonuclease, Rne/Rng family [Desulfonema limicola]|uniref:Ribonuclease G n=1 Tax=Desulfonema limicola TaxID=45656 RepID=A0A975BBX7_9BACT|nr:Rne/Rng family ribonuclease [Desulfonema limicola]QTA82430.1 Ribonuclease, Rne/Rng family [Desulfonema limicola]